MVGCSIWSGIPRGFCYLRRLLNRIHTATSPHVRGDGSNRSFGGSPHLQQGFDFLASAVQPFRNEICGRRYRRVVRALKKTQEELTSQSESQVSWGGLPDDIVLLIVSHVRADAIPWDSALKSLRQVSRQWRKAVAQSVTEIYLDLDHFQDPQYWKKLNVSFPKLTSLRTNWATCRGLENLSIVQNLSSLNLWGARIMTEGLHHLAQWPSLKFLNLGFTNITRRDLELVCRIRQLKSLDVSDTGVLPVDMQVLSTLQDLENLKLGSASWVENDYNVACSHLIEINQLKILDMGYSTASPVDIKKMLPRCSIRVVGLVW